MRLVIILLLMTTLVLAVGAPLGGAKCSSSTQCTRPCRYAGGTHGKCMNGRCRCYG
uniref:Toxin La-alphaKTx8 n=1 Tax=Liocheles australasiae TaxID=431266 RepID=KA12O_LIOAU